MTAATAKKTISERPRAELDTRALRVVDGRVVSLTLADPDVKKKLAASRQDLRRDPEKLKEYYVKAGLLTPSGKLPKRFGG